MSSKRPRWRSGGVKLVLLGTAGSLMTLLSGCSSNTTWSSDHHRNVYASEADCAVDYSAAVCAAKGEKRGERFIGPGYRVIGGRASACSSSDPGPGRSIGAQKVAVERGGFGPRCRTSTRSGSGHRVTAWGG